MSRRPIPSLAADFANVVAFLQSNGTVPKSPPPELLQTAKSIHASTYSLILWRFRLQRIPPHGQVFIEEIASDALQILPQIMLGFSKTAKLLTRGILENVLRHIYFIDHPVEFRRMNREGKWYLTMDQLCDYAKNLPDFLSTEGKFDAIAQVSSLYSKLSAGVHGRSVRDLEMRVALRKIAYDQTAAAAEAEILRRVAQAVNFLLAIFQREQMQQFQIEDQRLILRTLPTSARQVWVEHEPAF